VEKPKDAASAPARTELIWDGKYKDGKRVAPLRVELPFQTVETVNESAAARRHTQDLFGQHRATEWRNRLIARSNLRDIAPSLSRSSTRADSRRRKRWIASWMRSSEKPIPDHKPSN